MLIPNKPTEMAAESPRNWIAVASAEHVRVGRAAGFMQVGHGRLAPLRRVRPGDRVAYYSPTVVLGTADKFQSFTAVGIVEAGEPYQVDMGGGFQPFRRDVAWLDGHEPRSNRFLQAWSSRAEHRGGARAFGSG